MVKISKNFGEGLGNSGFTLGVLSVITAGVLGIFISIVGFIFCMIQQRKNPTKLAKVGVILNVIGFILSIAITIFVLPAIRQQLNL